MSRSIPRAALAAAIFLSAGIAFAQTPPPPAPAAQPAAPAPAAQPATTAPAVPPTTSGPVAPAMVAATPNDVSVPGMLTAECGKTAEGNTYLGITIHADPNGPRVSDIRGDVVIGGKVNPDWGLHLIDANLFMGNLVDIVRDETKAYQGAKH